jgi:nucleotide-binding universal stress UspA family protein/hemerythrin-like domain-containing protein
MTYRHFLVPIDGTPLGVYTVDGAIALARSLGARLTFFHVAADFGATADGALLHAVDPSGFAEGALGTAAAILAKAEAAARGGGVAAASASALGDRPHEAIVAAAEAHGCDLIYMASHGRKGLKAAWQGSVVKKLLEHATLPVLVACVESNLPASAEQRALATIKDEHRSLAAVVHALRGTAAAAAETGAPDFRLLGAMLYYIEHFPERLHHPKEESYLFRLLAQRTHACDAVLAELRRQHAEGAGEFAALREALASFEAGTLDATTFSARVESFVQAQWVHMQAEEETVMPAARTHLTTQDWEAIAAAFHDNGDPRFGADADEPFADLCARLLNLAGAAAGRGRMDSHNS